MPALDIDEDAIADAPYDEEQEIREAEAESIFEEYDDMFDYRFYEDERLENLQSEMEDRYEEAIEREQERAEEQQEWEAWRDAEAQRFADLEEKYDPE